MATENRPIAASTSADTAAAWALPFGLVLRQLHRQHFTVLSTVGPAGQAQSAGVSYGMSAPGAPLAL